MEWTSKYTMNSTNLFTIDKAFATWNDLFKSIRKVEMENGGVVIYSDFIMNKKSYYTQKS